MNHQELREAIFARKPRYNEKFKPLMERISTKGDVTGKGDFSTFGAFYQTFMNTTKKIGIILANLGTPDAPQPAAISRYLWEFLMDPLSLIHI